MIYTNAQTSLGHMVVLLSIGIIAIIFLLLKKAFNRSLSIPQQRATRLGVFTVLIFIWMGYLWIGGTNDWFARFNQFPPTIMPMVVLPPLLVMLYLVFSGKMDNTLRHMNQAGLVGIQAFRVAVELILWRSHVNGFTPEQMTFDGWNFDIISGVLAMPVMWWLLKKPARNNKAVIISYNIIGLLLLINIVTIAVLSFPGPTRLFANEPSNLLVSQYPFVYIPAIFVPIAYSFHLFSLRKLYITSSTHE